MDGLEKNIEIKNTINFLIKNDYADLLMSLVNNEIFDASILKNDNFLRLSVQCGSLDCLKILLSNGANASLDESQYLCQAVADNKNDIVRLLLKYGADSKADDNDPLRIAFNTRNYEAAKMLLSHGARLSDKRLFDAANRLRDVTLFNLLGKESAQLKTYGVM